MGERPSDILRVHLWLPPPLASKLSLRPRVALLLSTSLQFSCRCVHGRHIGPQLRRPEARHGQPQAAAAAARERAIQEWRGPVVCAGFAGFGVEKPPPTLAPVIIAVIVPLCPIRACHHGLLPVLICVGGGFEIPLPMLVPIITAIFDPPWANPMCRHGLLRVLMSLRRPLVTLAPTTASFCWGPAASARRSCRAASLQYCTTGPWPTWRRTVRVCSCPLIAPLLCVPYDRARLCPASVGSFMHLHVIRD